MARGARFCGVLGALALGAPALGAPAAVEAPAMMVATRDPALLSALDAVFSPRGVRVVASERPLHATGDELAGGERAADLVWLCDLPPRPSPEPGLRAAAASGAAIGPGGAPAPGQGTALCVRPRRGPVIVRRIAVATPLSPEDAAAVALSVQVALMPDVAPVPREGIARAAAPPDPSRARGAGAHSFTLELGGGARNGPDGTALRASAAAVYAPGGLGHHLGLGGAISAGPTYGVPSPSGRGPGPPPPSGSASDLTLRLFARGQVRIGPIWLQLDLGPEAHVMSRAFDEADRSSERRLHWSIDSFAGAVVPFGRFFAGARAGGSYLLTGRLAPTNPTGGTWNGEALATVGVGWF